MGGAADHRRAALRPLPGGRHATAEAPGEADGRGAAGGAGVAGGGETTAARIAPASNATARTSRIAAATPGARPSAAADAPASETALTVGVPGAETSTTTTVTLSTPPARFARRTSS